MKIKTRGAAEMIAAMLISGTVGWPVIVSGQPAVAIIVDWLVFGHRLSAVQLAGAGTILLAAAGMIP